LRSRQRALDAGGIGDIEVRSNSTLRPAAVPSPLAGPTRRSGRAGRFECDCGGDLGDDRSAQRRPIAAASKNPGLLDDVSNMRSPASPASANPQDRAIGRIVQLEPAIAAEHTMPSNRIVERLALNLDQGLYERSSA